MSLPSWMRVGSGGSFRGVARRVGGGGAAVCGARRAREVGSRGGGGGGGEGGGGGDDGGGTREDDGVAPVRRGRRGDERAEGACLRQTAASAAPPHAARAVQYGADEQSGRQPQRPAALPRAPLRVGVGRYYAGARRLQVAQGGRAQATTRLPPRFRRRRAAEDVDTASEGEGVRAARVRRRRLQARYDGRVATRQRVALGRRFQDAKKASGRSTRRRSRCGRASTLASWSNTKAARRAAAKPGGRVE